MSEISSSCLPRARKKKKEEKVPYVFEVPLVSGTTPPKMPWAASDWETCAVQISDTPHSGQKI